MKIDGGCQCGAITYEAEVDAEQVRLCNCTDCQQFSGSAFRVSAPAQESAFTLLSGSPKTYVKTAQSGGKRAQVFCSECGTHLYTTSVGDGPKIYNIRISTSRQRAELPPKRQIWTRSALPWLAELPSLPGVEGQ